MDAYLKQKATIMGVLLDDAVAVPSEPKVVLGVDEAPVQSGRHDAQLAKGIHHVASGVVFDDRRRRRRDEVLAVRQSVLRRAVYREDVVLRVDTGSADLAGDPRFPGHRVKR